MPSDSVIHAMAGAAGGIVAMSATYPLIFLSTRAAVDTAKEPKSTYQAVKDIVKREGILGLYSGVGSSLFGIAISTGIYYYFYERTKGAILRSKAGAGSKGLSTLEAMLAGLVAGSATTTLSNPIWVVQTTQATHTMRRPASAEPPKEGAAAPKAPGIAETVRFILRKDGVGGLWRGLGPALVLVVNPVLQYTVFEQLKNVLVKRRSARLRAAGVAVGAAAALLSDWDYFFLGALSKLVATSLTYPYIVVKSRLQAGHSHAHKYKSSWDGLLTIVQEEGIEGLYKGSVNKLIQSVLTAAILFAGQRRFYEITKEALGPISK